MSASFLYFYNPITFHTPITSLIFDQHPITFCHPLIFSLSSFTPITFICYTPTTSLHITMSNNILCSHHIINFPPKSNHIIYSAYIKFVSYYSNHFLLMSNVILISHITPITLNSLRKRYKESYTAVTGES